MVCYFLSFFAIVPQNCSEISKILLYVSVATSQEERTCSIYITLRRGSANMFEETKNAGK